MTIIKCPETNCVKSDCCFWREFDEERVTYISELREKHTLYTHFNYDNGLAKTGRKLYGCMQGHTETIIKGKITLKQDHGDSWYKYPTMGPELNKDMPDGTT